MTSYKDPDFVGRRCTRIAVMVGCSDLRIRADLEQRLVDELLDAGVFAISSVNLFPPTRSVAESTIVSVLREKAIDSYLVVVAGAAGVKEIHFPILGTTSQTTGTVTIFGDVAFYQQQSNTQIVGGGTEQMSWKYYRALLVDSETARTMWVADSYTEGNEHAVFSTVDDSYCEEIARRLKSQALIGPYRSGGLRAAEGAGARNAPPLSLGVQVRAVSWELASASGLAGRGGALVTLVFGGGPAELAGVVVGDIIVGFDGMSVKDPDGLQLAKKWAKANTPAQLEVWRDGESRVLQVMPEVAQDQ
jgi:hypothetical protein